MPIERRRAPRYPIKGKSLLVIEGVLIQGTLRDISLTGVSFVVDDLPSHFRGNTHIGLVHLESDDFLLPVDAFTSLRRTLALQTGFCIGCHFESIEDGPLHMLKSYLYLAKIRHQRAMREQELGPG